TTAINRYADGSVDVAGRAGVAVAAQSVIAAQVVDQIGGAVGLRLGVIFQRQALSGHQYLAAEVAEERTQAIGLEVGVVEQPECGRGGSGLRIVDDALSGGLAGELLGGAPEIGVGVDVACVS